MTNDIAITPADIEAVAGRLDELDLSERDRQVLIGVFVLAGEAAADRTAEVTGFALNAYKPGGSNAIIAVNIGQLVPAVHQGGLVGGFSWGMHGSGGGGGAGVPAVQHDISI